MGDDCASFLVAIGNEMVPDLPLVIAGDVIVGEFKAHTLPVGQLGCLPGCQFGCSPGPFVCLKRWCRYSPHLQRCSTSIPQTFQSVSSHLWVWNRRIKSRIKLI